MQTLKYKDIYTKLFFIGIMFFGLVYSGAVVKAAGECVCNVTAQSHTGAPIAGFDSGLGFCEISGPLTYKKSFDFRGVINKDTVPTTVGNALDSLVLRSEGATGPQVGLATKQACTNWVTQVRQARNEDRIDYSGRTDLFGEPITDINCENIKIEGKFWAKTAFNPTGRENKSLDQDYMRFSFSCALSKNLSDEQFTECAEDRIRDYCTEDGNAGNSSELTACITRLTNECQGKCADGSEQGNLGCTVATLFGGLNQLNITGNAPIQTFIGRAIQYVLGFVGSIALAMFVLAGLMWMTARGNSDRIAKALKIMTWAALGTVVILSSYVILNFIFDLLG